MKKILTMCLAFLALVSITTGCSSISKQSQAWLPSDDSRPQNQWQNFSEAQGAFEKIIPHETTVEDLKNMGFDPGVAPNVKILTYLDLIQLFMPNSSITFSDLPSDVRACIESKDCCQAYELTLDVTHNKRFGNVFLDAFAFKKSTKVTGWNFKALIIIKDDVVAYKLRSGQPNVDRVEKKVKPLGPFQELDGFARGMATHF